MHKHDNPVQGTNPEQASQPKTYGKTRDASARPAGKDKQGGIHPSLRALPDYPE